MGGKNENTTTDNTDLPADKNNAGGLPGIAPAKPPEIKRLPGRPLGSKTRRLNLSAPPENNNSGAPAGNGNNKPADDLSIPVWTPEDSRPFAELPFVLAASFTKYEGWALTEKEAEAISKPLAKVLTAFIPQGGKYAAISGLCSTAYVIYMMKNKGYQEFLKTHPKLQEPAK